MFKSYGQEVSIISPLIPNLQRKTPVGLPVCEDLHIKKDIG